MKEISWNGIWIEMAPLQRHQTGFRENGTDCLGPAAILGREDPPHCQTSAAFLKQFCLRKFQN